jgi:hypothetical protein
MGNILCKLFGHMWLRTYIWNNTLKVSVSKPTCTRCGTVDYSYYIRELNDFREHACKECGAWICTSGVCIYCNKGK